MIGQGQCKLIWMMKTKSKGTSRRHKIIYYFPLKNEVLKVWMNGFIWNDLKIEFRYSPVDEGNRVNLVDNSLDAELGWF